MSSESPLFSIIIPTYNRAHLISKTLESVMQQKFKNYEVLIVDDGSTDDTETVIGRYTDERIRYFKNSNMERGASRNFGAAQSKGSYLNFFDSDDLMYQNHLTEAARIITDDSSPEFFHLGYEIVTEDGRIVTKVNNFSNDMVDQLLFDNRLSCNGVFLRKEIAMNFPFSENRALSSSEDWELWIRLICRYPLHISNTITSAVVSHDQRSLYEISVEKLINRDEVLIANLKQDPVVTKRYGRLFNRFMAERYTFFMLRWSERKQYREVLYWAKRSFQVYPFTMFSKRYLASLRNLF
ncbi:MAG: glycosyltransferase family 2 protein [Flammeovirgaceae bacterium]|nr:glycosyltransferase family 2 protein [Flammeovirgaceae bacterium]